jgi:hypothetical protein
LRAPRAQRSRLSCAGTLGLLLLSAAAAVVACAGDDQKRVVDAGGGEAGLGSPDPGDAGAANGGGSSNTSLAGQTSQGGAAETAVGGGPDGTSGDGPGPELETLAPFGMLFSVAPGAQGLAATGVAESAPNAAGNLYSSTGSGATHVQGTNALGYVFGELGLDAGDDLDAVSAIHPDDASAFYFSVVDEAEHDEGVLDSGVRRSSSSGEVQSDIFMTYALAPLNGNGSNIEWVDEFRLGLTPETEGDASTDNLNALDIDVPPGTKPLFFSVAPGALGAAGSAVATVAADELGCTVFSSELDGDNAVAFSCADLGLVPGDDIDALVVLGVGDEPRRLLFSVTPGSVGAAATGVAQQVGQAAADVFASDGSGTNTTYIEERALGLLADDDVDALAVETTSDPGRAWLPPPPEEPAPPEPPPCPWPLARLRTNPGADAPVPHSAPSMGTRVAKPGGKIIKTSTLVRRLNASHVARLNALQRCGTQRGAGVPTSSLASRLQVICPAGATELTPGDYVVGMVETEAPLDFDAFPNVQVALIVDTDDDPANNYLAQPPYTFDTFDGTDRALQLQKSGSSLIVRTQDISVDPFQNVSAVPDRIVIQGRRYFFILQVPAAIAFPHRFTVFAANGADWTMSNVALVGEPMEIADLSSCP